MSTPMPILRVQNVSKRYGDRAIHEKLGFQIDPGKFYALLGENGSGKSTLMRMLAGLEAPDHGQVELCGHDIGMAPVHLKAMIGHVSEGIDYDLDLSMERVAKMIAAYYPTWDWELFKKITAERGFPIQNKYRSCSRGQKVQFSLIMALCQGAKLLLLDEITSVLDVYARKYFMGLLSEFVSKGGTVVLATNIIGEVQHSATNMLFLKEKGIKIDCPVAEVPLMFKKIRRTNDDPHPVFSDPKCYWAGTNSDGSTSYIVSLDMVRQYGLDKRLEDRRAILLEDIFVYYFNMKEERNEQAA